MSGAFFEDLLSAIAERGRALLDGDRRRGGGEDLGGLAERLLSGQGEASGVALARELLDAYEAADETGKAGFLALLAARFGPDAGRLDAAIAGYRQAPSDATALALHAAAEARRQELIRRLNLAPGGTAALVAMRAFLLDRLKAQPELGAVDSDFHHLLSSWFNRGFLVMQRIDWNMRATVLEKIIRYEAVHAIGDWDDLRRRIDPADRRCYGFFHPALVDEPLIFVEVALTQGMPDAIAPILAAERTPLAAGAADTAAFYSISNCQAGLAGVSFGNFLIKQVVEELHRDLPHLQTFVTLSPAPGFTRWLRAAAADMEEPEAGEKTEVAEGSLTAEERDAIAALDDPAWPDDPDRAAALRDRLLPLAARYFLHAKTRGEPLDPVARFHLGNGARLERLNWLGDRSAKGLRQAAGLMVNYRYVLPDIEKNHEAYATKQKVVAASGVTRLAKSRS